MATRISVVELQTGMFIQKLGGSWLKHPFLRGSFLLTNPDDIRAIRDAGIQEVWIDCAKGAPPQPDQVRTAPPESEAPPEQAAGPQQPPPEVASAACKSSTAPSMASEIERARKICRGAKGAVTAMFNDIRLGKAIDPQFTLPLVEEISASLQRNASAILSVARLKDHDDYTYMHSVAVCALMLSLARQLGLDEQQTKLAGVGGLMHDLGKALMPLDILNKPGKLTDQEFAVMRSHSAAGAKVLKESGAPIEVQDIALHHHEKVNGQGYPHGLAGEEISLLARMGAVCDVYDAVTSHRPYKQAWDPAKAIREMARWEGHFDKQVFNAFVKAVGIYPTGSLVRLASNRLAVVLEPHAESLLTPKVRVFFSLRSKEPIPVQTLDLASPSCKDSITGPEDPEAWGFKHLDELWQ